MRFFVYKTLFVFLCLIIAYKLTVGNTVNKLGSLLENIKKKESIEKIKSKLKKEMQNSINKDRILNKEDAVLIQKFLKKIQDELSQQN